MNKLSTIKIIKNSLMMYVVQINLYSVTNKLQHNLLNHIKVSVLIVSNSYLS
jgi:hypothetical protein